MEVDTTTHSPSAKEGQMFATSGTPSGRAHVTRTPVSAMSSSLRERLKKCGRYHPASPRVSLQQTPTSSQHSTPIHGSQQPVTPLSSQPATPSTLSAIANDVGQGHRRFPRPRNILKERSNLFSPCVNTVQSSEDLVENGTKDSESTADGMQGEQVCQSHVSCGTGGDRHCSNRDNVFQPLSTVKSTDTSKQAFVTLHDKCDNRTDSTTKQHLPSVATSLGSTDSVTYKDLITAKKQMNTELLEQREVLRKLNMVKTYRSKNDLDHLQGLIEKWRSACQQAILDLHQLTPEPRPSLTQLVQHLGVDKKLTCYNEEEECFESE